MKPINFRQSNDLSKGKNGNGDLHYYSNGKQCVSCWNPSFFERIRILFGGKVWLFLRSATIPPVAVSGKFPFEKNK